MKLRKWVFILMAFCLLFAVTPATASAGETGSQTADQVQEETVAEEETADQVQEETAAEEDVQAEETAQQDAHSILLHIPFVCLIMAIVLTGFILWGKNQEKKEKQ